MKHFLLGSAGWLALLAPLAGAESETARQESLAAPIQTTAKADSPLEGGNQFETLMEEYSRSQREFSEKYSKAKDAKERSELRQERPQPAQFADRFLELAAKTTDEQTAIQSLTWVVTIARAGDKTAKALQLLGDKYVQSEHLAPVFQGIEYSDAENTEWFLRKAVQTSPHSSVQGLACYTLAKYLKQQSQLAETLKNRPELLEQLKARSGAERATRLQALDPAQLKVEVEKLLTRVVQSHGDVPLGQGTLKETAERELFEIQHLSVGCVAPEIEGEDIQGVTFKLSDYRGKVVMLDFWGHW